MVQLRIYGEPDAMASVAEDLESFSLGQARDPRGLVDEGHESRAGAARDLLMLIRGCVTGSSVCCAPDSNTVRSPVRVRLAPPPRRAPDPPHVNCLAADSEEGRLEFRNERVLCVP